MNNDPIPDFILNNQNDYSPDSISVFWGWASNDPIPDFIKNQEEDIVVSPKKNLMDEEVKTQLGVDFDNSFSSDSKQVKEYVDSLSDEDYELWDQRREEWYSLDARKALMDNRELVNSEKGNLKYKINTPDLWNRALNYIQNLNEWYETMHPWTKSAQEWLDEASMFMEEKLGKENLMNQWIDKNDLYSKMSPKLAEWAINNYETFVNLIQIPKVVGQTITYSSSKILNIIDQFQNWIAALPAEAVDLYQRIQGKDPIFNLQYDEERSNPLWSYLQIIKDWLWVGFVVSYPVATYLMSLLGSTNENVQDIQEKFYNKPKELFQWLLNLDWTQNLMEIAWLNAKDQESLVEALTDWIFLLGWAFFPKLFKNKTVELHKEAFKQANEFSKKYGKYKMREWFTAKEVAWWLPEWTEVLNKKWKSIAVSTAEWWKFTPRWALETWLQWAKGYAEMFRNYWKWFYQNYNKRNVNRNPYAPVWELPNIVGAETTAWKPTKVAEWEKVEEVKEELTPEREAEIKEKWFYTDEKPIIQTPKKVTPKESWLSIWEFIKKNINKITNKQWWLNKDLVTKLQNSKDLQNEYVNTIDPYIRENWTNNPEWVIQEQLNSLVETVKDKIIEKKVNNQIFRRWQKQYKVEITEEEKNNQKIEDDKIKKLLKAIEKQSDSPEELLKYLLRLPKETVDEFNQLIPDFSQNLSLIKDTLDITKAITSSDLLWKFLQFKSTWGTRNKNYLRKYLYKYLNDKYAKQWLKRNMYEIENIINKMSDKQLNELEKNIEEGKMNAWTDDQISDYNERWYMLQTYEKTLQNFKDSMNQKRYGTNKTIGEYLKEKQVPLSVTSPEYVNKITRSFWLKGGWLAAYHGELDRILLPDVFTYEWMIFHEFGHRVLNQLGTTQIMDIITYISKRDKISADAAFERRAEYFRNYMRYNNIDWKKYLIKKIGEDLTSKIDWVTQRIKEEVWDLFDIEDETELEINQIMNDIKHDTPAWQDIVSRRPEPLTKWKIGEREPVRYEWLRSWDPTVKEVQVNPYFDQQLEISFNDGRSPQKRSDYKKWLSEEQLKEIDTYENDYLNQFVEERLKDLGKWRKYGIKGEGEFNYDKMENERSLTDIMMDAILQTRESLGLDAFQAIDYLKILKDIDPDILGLVEKDGQIYVKYLMESQWERYELPDRPGYIEVKEVPAKDYFSEEELNQLPKDLVTKIKKDAN